MAFNNEKTCKDTNKCIKRSLVDVANMTFKDKRAAKKWLQAPNPSLNNEKPIDAIVNRNFTPKQIMQALRQQTKDL